MTYIDMAWIGNFLASFQEVREKVENGAVKSEASARQLFVTSLPDYAAADETGAVPLPRKLP